MCILEESVLMLSFIIDISIDRLPYEGLKKQRIWCDVIIKRYL